MGEQTSGLEHRSGRLRRVKAKPVLQAGKAFESTRFTRLKTMEGSHFLLRRHPAQAFAWAVIQKPIDALDFRLADSGKGGLPGISHLVFLVLWHTKNLVNLLFPCRIF